MFLLPLRKFEYGDFVPVVDEKTMEIHYGKHHQTYVDNLNKLLPNETRSLEEVLKNIELLPESIRQGVVNNAGGCWNHAFWWEQLCKPQDNNLPEKRLLDAICVNFGSFDMFMQEFLKVAMGRFGSGWVWLMESEGGKLSLESTGNQDCPVMYHKVPLLGLDVWEHAYYLNYQNRRADYVGSFWKIINWTVVESRMSNRS